MLFNFQISITANSLKEYNVVELKHGGRANTKATSPWLCVQASRTILSLEEEDVGELAGIYIYDIYGTKQLSSLK